ncbi:MAG: hypothetical protein R2729_00560 [Bryobacteraceae bacterium]
MRERVAWLAVPALILLFLVANRAAYKGYFSSDDLDNIAWTGRAQVRTFVEGIADPFYIPQHFRPVGHFVFFALGLTDYRWYVAVVHGLHILNVALLFLVLRRLYLGLWGALFFAFPMAVFDALWKPMYVFDVWCATFVLLTFLQYLSGRTVLSLLCFWLAYKSKEIGAMAAFGLVAYEYWLGKRDWRRVAPFVAVALWFTGQAVLANRAGDQGSDYELKATPAAVWTTVKFYASRVLLRPWVLAAVAGAAVWLRDRRAAWGFTVALLLIAPLLLLPGRLYPAYLYAPMIGVAIAVGVIFSRIPWAAAAGLMAIWWVLNFQVMRIERNTALAEMAANRTYVSRVFTLPKRFPDTRLFLYDGAPPGMEWWGVKGALRLAYDTDDIELKQVQESTGERPYVLLAWNESYRMLEATAWNPSAPPLPMVRFLEADSAFQLRDGWYPREGDARWSQPVASAKLWRPANAARFEMTAAAPQKASIAVSVDGKPIGGAALRDSVWDEIAIPLAPGAPEGAVTVEWRVTPPLAPHENDSRVLGVLVKRFGFVAGEAK